MKWARTCPPRRNTFLLSSLPFSSSAPPFPPPELADGSPIQDVGNDGTARKRPRPESPRLNVTGQCPKDKGAIKQEEAAQRLGTSSRQLRNVAHAYRLHAAYGLIHGNHGKASNRKIREASKQSALQWIRKQYWDFGPTLAHEKLTERRPCFGELIQIDDSPHDWVEGRVPKCTLLVFIDDATSRLLALRVVPSETTEAYMTCLKWDFEQYARPVSFYSDKHSIFRINQEDAASGEHLTQCGGVLKTLEIEAIHANSPQAKGPCGAGPSDLAGPAHQGNAACRHLQHGSRQGLPGFLHARPQPQICRRTGIRCGCALHNQQELEWILSIHSGRKLSQHITLQYNNTLYQVKIKGIGYAMRGATVTIYEDFQHNITLLYNGKSLTYETWKRGKKPPAISDAKEINLAVRQTIHSQAQRQNWKPALDHPWRKPLRPQTNKRNILFGRKPEISTLG